SGNVEEFAAGARIGDFSVHADIRCIERVGKCFEVESEVVVDSVGSDERARCEKGPRILDAEMARSIIPERFRPSLHAESITRRRAAQRQRATPPLFVGAEKAIEAVNATRLIGKAWLVGNDVDRARQGVGSV